MVWPKNIKTILIIALVIRLILAPWTYHGDITVTYWWGKFASEFTWPGFYDWLNFGGYGRPDQPMLNIYYVWFIRQLFLFFHSIFWYLNTHIPAFPSNFMQWFFINGNQILLKIPMILADVAIIFFIFKYTHNLKLSLIIALFPPLIYNSAVWGSGDSIINLFGLLSIFYIFNKKYWLSALFFIFSVLYKSSLLIWSPIFLVILIKNKPSLKTILSTTTFSLALIFLISFPFTPKDMNVFLWFYNTMTTKVLPGAMQQITVNAMNFWAIIFGLLPQRLDDQLFLNLITYRNISLLVCLLFYIHICLQLYRNYNKIQLLLSLVQISMVTFTFMTRMHERYTFPALIPLLVLCFTHRSFYKYLIILTVTHLLNTYNWWWTPNIPMLIVLLQSTFVIKLISVTNTLLTLALLFKKYQYRSNLKTHQPVS